MLVVSNRLPPAIMKIDIEKVMNELKSNEKRNAVAYPDLKVKNVTIQIAAKEGIDYWVVLTLDSPVRGMYSTVKTVAGQPVTSFAKGLTTTVWLPLGLATTLLFDALFDVDDDETTFEINGETMTLEDIADSIGDYKRLIVDDAKNEAKNELHVSHLHKMLRKTSVSIIAYDVYKEEGSVPAVFALNERNRQVTNDSVWHEAFGMKGLNSRKLVDAYKYCIEKNGDAKAAATAAPAQNPLLAALLAATMPANAATVNSAV